MPYPSEEELAPMPTLGIDEFSKLFEDKLIREFTEYVNECLINIEVESVETYEDFVNSEYIDYLETSISNFYVPKGNPVLSPDQVRKHLINNEE